MPFRLNADIIVGDGVGGISVCCASLERRLSRGVSCRLQLGLGQRLGLEHGLGLGFGLGRLGSGKDRRLVVVLVVTIINSEGVKSIKCGVVAGIIVVVVVVGRRLGAGLVHEE